MTDVLSMYRFDKTKAKQFLKYLCLATVKQGRNYNQKRQETAKLNYNNSRMNSLEQRNIELTKKVIDLSRRLNQVNEKKAEQAFTSEITHDIMDRESKIKELEKKIGEKLKLKHELEKTKKIPITENTERMQELEQKIRNKLEGEKLNPIKTHLKNIKKQYAKLRKSKKYSKKKLDKIREKIKSLEKKLDISLH
ncbi:hypothetical protein JXB41_08060 [Candidatus Woesearchaeota archaeon]|nr:hypothetical protein [Candidatus Woesearchaeota archaeon]